jgi:hypothetical protein
MYELVKIVVRADIKYNSAKYKIVKKPYLYPYIFSFQVCPELYRSVFVTCIFTSRRRRRHHHNNNYLYRHHHRRRRHRIPSQIRPGWPVSVSAFTSSSSLFSGRPGHRLPFG